MALKALVCALLVLGVSPALAGELWPELSSPPAATGGGEKDAAVIIGAENYLLVAKVPGARKNAEDWQAYLTDTLKVPSDRVSLLRDNEATLEKMRRYAAQAASQVEEGGTLWFVFIGHGAPSKDGKDGLLVGADAQQDPDGLYARSLPRNELLGELSKGKQAKTVVLLDACFSGRSTSGEALVSGLQPLVLMRDPAGKIDGRMVLLTAAKSDQFAGPLPKAAQARPAFSYLALGALRGWAADAQGSVTAKAVVDFARRALSLDKGRTQTPELTVGAPGSVLGHGREAAPDLSRIDREGGPAPKAGGPDFQVSNLPAVPQAEAPKALDLGASGLDLSTIDVDSLEKYDAVFKFDQSEAPAAEKARRWRALGKEAPKYADLAAKRAEEWDRFAAQEKAAESAKRKRTAARDSDWAKLSRLLALSVVPEADKARWSGQFVDAYLKSPGIDPESALELVKHLPSGPAKDEVAELAKAAPAPSAGSKEDSHGTPAPAPRAPGKSGIEWVRIPGGTFIMGSAHDPSEDIGRAIGASFMGLPVLPQENPTEPIHRVTVKPFKLAKSPVTNKQYRACVSAGACAAQGQDCLASALRGDDQPAVCVDWEQAKAFCEWAGGRLPTEAEWEYAARSAGKDQKYPWGSGAASCEKAVMSDGGDGCGRGATWPVCSKAKGRTAQGLCDMAGNARQWVQDRFHGSYSGAPDDGSAWEDSGFERVGRGGSWYSAAADLQAASRGHYAQDVKSDYIGFRPAKDD